MKTSRNPVLLLGSLYVGFVGYLAWSASQLPAYVASHFDGSGRVDGWMECASYLLFIVLLGVVFPLLVPAICYVSRFMPDKLHNIPHRDYWLAPERRAETMLYLVRHSLWFAALALGFVIGVHALVVHANGVAPTYLPPPLIVGLAGCFATGAGVWAFSLFRHFNRVI